MSHFTNRIGGTVSRVDSITIVGYADWKVYDQLFTYIARALSEYLVHLNDIHTLDQQDFDKITDEYEHILVLGNEAKELIGKIRNHKDFKRADYICIQGGG